MRINGHELSIRSWAFWLAGALIYGWLIMNIISFNIRSCIFELITIITVCYFFYIF